MNLEMKVKKLGLASLDDHKRYAFALNKDNWKSIYKKYDYFKLNKHGDPHFYSKEYLEKNTYRELKRKWKISNFETLGKRLELLLFKLDVRITIFKHKIKLMFYR